MYGPRPPDVDERVWLALQRLPREIFVPPTEQLFADEDAPLPIGSGQTISQPSLVALMTSLAEVGPGSRVLEVGTGSGFQSALLALLGAEVFSIEIVPGLAERARETLAALGLGGVTIRVGDGSLGWPEEGPYDAVVVTAAAPRIPTALLEQLAEGGRLVIPVGEPDRVQELLVITAGPGGAQVRAVCPVRFVPMVGSVRGH